MLPQKFWKACESTFFFFLPAKSANVSPLEERVSMLHPYRMESYLIPSVSILFSLFRFLDLSLLSSRPAAVRFAPPTLSEKSQWRQTAGAFHPELNL